ncbi:MAG: right-handed parallel beta-helix repeat-containing protein [Candidatus Sifarchaeia archaeon]
MRERYAATIIIVCILFLLVNPLLIMAPSRRDFRNLKLQKSIEPAAYIECPPFSIAGNADFALKAVANGWQGNGTYSNPFIINNLNITSTSGSTILTSISNTDVYFRIEGCIFVGGSIGIQFANVANGIIFNNTIQDSSLQGCVVGGSHNIQFGNNSISRIKTSGLGLYWFDSHNCSISNNTIEGNCDRGILMDYSTNCSISHNTISYHSVLGFKLRDSNGNMIHGNTIYSNGIAGITLGNANNCTLTENIVFNNSEVGIDLQWSSHTLIQSNLIYNHPEQGVRIYGPSNAILNNTIVNNSISALQIWSSGSSIKYNNFIDNGKEWADVQDDTSDNKYDYNYWSQWTWPDADNDMIVDNFKHVSEAEGNYDYHPVTVPYKDLRIHILSKPHIINPDEYTANIHTSCIVTWMPSGDTFRHTIQYSLDYSTDEGEWIEIGAGISVNYYFWNLTSIPDRTNITFRVTAYCSSGNSTEGYSKAYIVLENMYIPPNHSPPDYLLRDLSIGLGGSAIVLVLIFLLVRKRRSR